MYPSCPANRLGVTATRPVRQKTSFHWVGSGISRKGGVKEAAGTVKMS